MPSKFDPDFDVDFSPDGANPSQGLARDAVFTLLALATGTYGDARREGLKDTPHRVVRAFGEWFSGYGVDPAKVIKEFKDGAERTNADEMVIVKDIPIYSHCEHHMAAIFGVAHIGYIPNGSILGLSKFKRLADVFARRLQVQERLGSQIADALEATLEPLGCAVILECRHMCMESRGVNTPGSTTVTTALRGKFKELSVRTEFLSHVARK